MRRLHVCIGTILLIISPVVASAQSFSSAPARPATAAAQVAKEAKPAPSPSPEIAEQHTTHAMEAAKALGDGALYAFLLQMPKGGDLHNHITGAGYAESY